MWPQGTLFWTFKSLVVLAGGDTFVVHEMFKQGTQIHLVSSNLHGEDVFGLSLINILSQFFLGYEKGIAKIGMLHQMRMWTCIFHRELIWEGWLLLIIWCDTVGWP